MKIYISFLVILFFSVSCQTKQKAKKPNILFISVDDLRPDLGVYGNDFIKTPNIDEFARDGIVFERAYSQAAVCAPSRASLMQGLRPDSTRVWHLGDSFRKINPDAVTMPQYFDRFGYHTVSMGKIFHNYMPDSVSWDEPDLRPHPYDQPEYLGRDAETFYATKEAKRIQKRRRDSILSVRNVEYANGWNVGPVVEMGEVPDTAYYDGAQTDLAIKTIKRIKEKNQPFYFALGYYRPHLPFAVPKKYWDLYDRSKLPLPPNSQLPEGAPEFSMNSMYELRAYAGTENVSHPVDGTIGETKTRLLRHGYFASISYVDALIGKLLDELKRMDLYEDTIIVIWGDHGWKLGDLGSWGKMTNYEIDIRSPLIIKSGSNKPSENKSDGVLKTDALVELVDMFPTISELAGLEIPNYLDGRSLVPLMDNPNQQWKEAVYSQFHRRPKVAHDGGRYMGYSIRTDRFHMIEWYTWDNQKNVVIDSVTSELYDHKRDSLEKKNRINEDIYLTDILDLHSKIRSNFSTLTKRN